jgi:hypothetical protein
MGTWRNPNLSSKPVSSTESTNKPTAVLASVVYIFSLTTTMSGNRLKKPKYSSKVVVIAHGERIRKGLIPRFGFCDVPIIWASIGSDMTNLCEPAFPRRCRNYTLRSSTVFY